MSQIDINWQCLSADSHFSVKLCYVIFQYNFIQFVEYSTCIHGNILDLIITNNNYDNNYDYDYDRMQGRGTACLPNQNTYYINYS